MKVESGRGVAATTPSKRSGESAGAGFSVAADATSHAAPASGISGVTALDAVLALQAEETPMQRRSRQKRRGFAALDALEELEQGLLSGHAPAALKAELERLQRGGEATGDARLDDLMREIDTRLAVEVAKLDRQLAGA